MQQQQCRPLTLMHVRQVTMLYAPIKAITCWSPDVEWVIRLIWLGFLRQQELHMCMIIKDAIKCSLHSVPHIMHECLFIWLIFTVIASLLLSYHFLAMILTSSVKAEMTEYLPGWVVTLIPESGRSMCPEPVISSNLSFLSSDPGKPLPISGRYMLKLTSVPMAKTQ